MSFQERRALVSLGSSIVINAVYLAYMLPRQPAGDPYAPEVFRFWGEFFLILILVSIIIEIAVTILFSILNTIAMREAVPTITDERDRLIELKASRIGFYAFTIGFLLAMIALAMGMTPSTMFIIMMIGGVASQVVDHFSAFWFYRRGV